MFIKGSKVLSYVYTVVIKNINFVDGYPKGFRNCNFYSSLVHILPMKHIAMTAKFEDADNNATVKSIKFMPLNNYTPCVQ